MTFDDFGMLALRHGMNHWLPGNSCTSNSESFAISRVSFKHSMTRTKERRGDPAGSSLASLESCYFVFVEGFSSGIP